MRAPVLAALLFLATQLPAGLAPARALDQNDYGVYCVRGRLVIEHRGIEELKASQGEDVCRLDQDPTETGARDKALRLGGANARCTCE